LDYPVAPPNEIEEAIARNVAALVNDRDTVQLGFGTLPMAIGHLLCERKELGVHTEMFCEAHIDLLEAGAVTNAHKGLYDGISVATFALGTPRLHKWMKDNKDIALLPVEETNRPDVLAKVNNLTSVNSVLGVDMTGQTTAHCIGPMTYSGLGGAFEFAYGAQLSPGGRSIVCMPSTTTLKDGTVISNVVAQYPAGTRVTAPEHITDWVVTEHGAVHLKALCIEERAKALLNVAHPGFREPLEKNMREAGIKFDKLDRTPGLPAGSVIPAQ
jgi:4-hydroxybutyrate CoA-transferase